MYDFLKYFIRKALYNSTFSRTYEKLFKFHGILAEHFSNIKISVALFYTCWFFSLVQEISFLVICICLLLSKAWCIFPCYKLEVVTVLERNQTFKIPTCMFPKFGGVLGFFFWFIVVYCFIVITKMFYSLARWLSTCKSRSVCINR